MYNQVFVDYNDLWEPNWLPFSTFIIIIPAIGRPLVNIGFLLNFEERILCLVFLSNGVDSLPMQIWFSHCATYFFVHSFWKIVKKK